MRSVQPLAGLAQIRSTLLDSAERSAVPVRSGELRAGTALAAFAPLDISRSSLQNPETPYVTVATRILQGKGIHHRARISWKLARSAKPAARETVRIRRYTATGPVVLRCTHRETGASGTFTSKAFHALRGGRKAAYVIDVSVQASDGTVLGTGRQIRQFR